MPHADPGGPLAKRQRTSSALSPLPKPSASPSRIFAPFRTVGLVSPTGVPFTSTPLGKTTFQITTSTGRSLQTYDLRRGLNLVFVTRPQTPTTITATCAWKQKVIAAWGGPLIGSNGSEQHTQGLWVFQRGRKVDELALPMDMAEPIKQIVVFGTWIVASALTRIEVFKAATLEHYTTIHTMAASNGGNEITGGLTTMPTFLNKVFVGRRDGWVEMWNVSTGKLIYTILPPSPDCGAVTCLEPSPALSLMAIAYSEGSLVITNVLSDKVLIRLDAASPEAPISSISFRTDGIGAGHDGRKPGVMATATLATGDVTFWDLNSGGRLMGVLRGAHNPPSGDGSSSGGGVSRVEFLSGQPVMMTSGRDNSLRSWVFDATPFSPIPRMLHSRSGHAGQVNCLEFLPSDFDGAEAGNKWLLSGGKDRSLWGWSLRRDGQSTELSQGNMRSKAKKAGILSTSALARGPTTLLEDLKAPEIICIASSLNRDGGIGAMPGKQPIWQKGGAKGKAVDAELSAMTGWESVVTAHRGDAHARTWFWGRKRAGRWALPTGDGANVSTVAMSPCGSFAVVGSEGGSIVMYNLQSGKHRQRFPSSLTPAQARQLRLQQLRQADDVAQLQSETGGQFAPGTGKHSKAVSGLVVDATNSLVVSSSLDGTVGFWDFLTGRLLHRLDWSPAAAPICCRYHAANNLLAFACTDRTVRVVDLDTKKTIRRFGGARGAIRDLCFSSDGRWLVVASQDRVVRVWDLSTSYLIDAFLTEKVCTSLCMSVTGEYLAVAMEGEAGVGLWTNRSLFRYVANRQVSDDNLVLLSAPAPSGEGGQGLLEAAFEGDEGEEGEAAEVAEEATVAPTVEQLSADLTTLSLVPRSRWQTLLHLDLIKERNRPKEAPKAPEKAPFFLGSSVRTGRLEEEERRAGVGGKESDDGETRIGKLDRARLEDEFSSRLRAAAEEKNYERFIEHLKMLAPSRADVQLRSLSVGEGGEESNELLHFIRALTERLKARRDYELTQAWMAVFLRLHLDVIGGSAILLEALEGWKACQEAECDRLDDLVGYCSGVVGFLRSPRS